MPKKTRKKSPKPSARQAARAQIVKPTKTPPSQTRAAAAGKSGRKQAGNLASEASHKVPSKPLKPPAAASGRARAKAIAAAKPVAAIPQKPKPPGGKSTTPADHKSGLAEGARAPDFHLPRDGGSSVSLSDYAGKKLVLFFYPRADTPGCTIESCGFRDAFKKFQKEGIVVLGISRDTVKDQKKFKDKYDLPYDLLADPDMELINRYDLIKPKNMYGKLVKGVKRTTYLIGPDQRLIHIFEEVKPEGHAEEVLTILQQKK